MPWADAIGGLAHAAQPGGAGRLSRGGPDAHDVRRRGERLAGGAAQRHERRTAEAAVKVTASAAPTRSSSAALGRGRGTVR